MAFTCSKCSEAKAALTAILFGALGLTVLFLVGVHMVTSKADDRGEREPMTGLSKRAWVQPIKIVIVVWQIVTQVRDTAAARAIGNHALVSLVALSTAPRGEGLKGCSTFWSSWSLARCSPSGAEVLG